jgi:hypothetical protein
MFDRLFPAQLDNNYKGWRTALWLFGFGVLVRALQSVMIIFNSQTTVKGADGIPLDSYPADAAANIVAMFGQSSLWRLIFCLAGAVVLIRYRTAVPMMCVLFLLVWVAAQLLSVWTPLIRTGTPPGTYVNLVMAGLMALALVLSLVPRRISA